MLTILSAVWSLLGGFRGVTTSLISAALAGWIAYHSGHLIGYNSGWSEGQAAQAAQTQKALDDLNAKAKAAGDHALKVIEACKRTPGCKLPDDGWRINP